ncbi:MAG: SDR family NAD(P)-dependent oxidoreductase [Nitriliruptoraceae bacterium]
MPLLPSAVTRTIDAGLEATVVLSFSKVGYAVRSRLERWQPVTDLPGAGRRVLVTGANSGLGYATSRALLAAGAEVVATVRSEDKARETRRRLCDELGPDIDGALTIEEFDLADLSGTRDLATRLRGTGSPLDAVVHNAGALFAEREETVDGLERTYQVHVVAPFLLTSLLLPLLAAGEPGRVVTLTSGGMYTQRLDGDDPEAATDYRGTTAYARAKRAQVELTGQWARRFAASGLRFDVVHPGWALTPGVAASLPRFRQLMGPLLRDPDEGADTIAYLVLADDLPTSGRLWHDRRPRGEHRVPWTVPPPGAADALWSRVCHDAGVEPALD